jgi:hypothetical protein
MRALIASLFIAAAPLSAQEVDLELVLLADASGSITQAELEFQRQGYAEAIASPEVIKAIASTMTGSIAVTYVEWAANQATVVHWTILDGEASARAFAVAILAPPRQAFGRNAIGAALLQGKRLIETNSLTGLRRVIDFSGDSVGNFSGPSISEARAEVLDAGITINGLPIQCDECFAGSGGNLEAQYREMIIGGPGSFVIAATGRNTFASAVRRKLVLEISGLTPAAEHAALISSQPPR